MNMQAVSPEDLLRVSLKKKWWILASVVVCVALGYVAWKYSPKTFKSTVVMTIDSPRIAKEYVKGLSQAREARYDDDPMVILVQQIVIGLTNASILMPVLDTLKPYPDEERASSDQLMKRLRKAVTVGRPKDGVGVAVSYVNPDPLMAQAVTALLAMKLQEDNLKRREGIVETTTEFLSVELERVMGDLEAKERAISDFKRAHLGELPQQMEANLRTLDRLQTDLTSSTESLNKMRERLTALEKGIKEFTDLAPTGFVPFERERRVVDARPIDSRATRLRELKQKLNELSGTYKENYPDVVRVKEEIRRLESASQGDGSQPSVNELAAGKTDDGSGTVLKSADPYLRELMKERNEAKNEIGFLKEKQANTTRQIKELEAHVEHTPTREQGLAALLRDYENMQKGYQALLDKRTNVRILGNYENRQFGEQYRIIDPASFPDVQEPPTRVHFLLGGLAVGCLIGFGSAIGVEFLRAGFRRPEEVENNLGLPVIASIPAFASAMKGIGMMQSRALLTGPGRPGGIPDDESSFIGSRKMGVSVKLGKKEFLNSAGGLSPKFHLIAKWGPATLMAEQYRVAATRLILMTAEKKNVVTLVTSSVMGEGKTTTAVNLAYILAHDLSKSTLLIDCDFKRPMVHEYMDIPAGPGLGDVLQGGEILENCIHQCDGVPLWILPSGSPRVRPAGLSGIQYVKQILPELRTRYDHVILDGPPVMPLADVNILSALTDMTAFVVRAGGTSQDIAKKALRTLGETTDAAGIILTQVEMEYAPYFMYAAPYTNEGNGSRA
jgi:polysaccharide chain length determinant protein (PEP-CTERM system associated)